MTTSFHAWPDERLWNQSFQVTRLLGIIDFGGADFTEIHEAIQRITPGDDESWHREWYRLGALCERQGHEAMRYGNRLTVRYAYQRASNYYRAAQFYLPGSDPRKLPILHKVRDTFRTAMQHFDHPCETVEIPYENTTLSGYFVPARHAMGRLPTILYLNGLDSLSEEAYFTVALPASLAGYHCLVFNAPGVGLTLYEKGLSTRYDCEHFVTPALDFLLQRPEVDPARVAVVGESFAGYLVPRAAAFEPRFAAAVGWGASFSWGSALDPEVTHPFETLPPPVTPHRLAFFGARDAEEWVKIRAQFRLADVMHRLKCPYLVIVGTEDFAYAPVQEAIRMCESAGSQLKKCVVVERSHGLGGVLHCQKDNLHVLHAYTFNFLNEVLDYRPKTTASVAHGDPGRAMQS